MKEKLPVSTHLPSTLVPSAELRREDSASAEPCPQDVSQRELTRHRQDAGGQGSAITRHQPRATTELKFDHTVIRLK